MKAPKKSNLSQSIALALAGACAAMVLPSGTALAQTAPPAARDDTQKVEGITVIGSRRLNASSTDTPVPVDFIALSKATEQGGQFDLAQTLNYISPSFNTTRQTGADGADLIDSAALRGLGSDQTLVLVNGKRRHTVSLVNLFGARNRGNTGTDMNSLPLLAIDNVQVLRDGAAAQYGSDAIAGVIDITLKKKKGCEAIFGYGQYSEGDGKNYLTSGYCGFTLADKGVLALTAEYLDRGRSNRAEPGNPRIIGDTKSENFTFYGNGEVPTSPTGKLYFTAGVQTRDASSGAFARGGVGSGDIPSRNSAAMYPDGFVPFINGDVDDRYFIIGHKGQWGAWKADLSQTYGYNRLKYNISNTLNASIANRDLTTGGRGISPNRFDAGGFSFDQSTTNFDLSKFYEGIAKGMNVATGLEYRRENYKIFAGEPGSYNDVDGVGVGGNAGSQGFPGFQPADVTDKKRNSWAAYLDIETDLSDAFKVQTAVRHEHYSDFGSTTTAKLAASFRASENVLFRGAFSTGFRAPSLQQVFFSSTFTDFISGRPLDVVLAPNGSRIANAAGIPKLKEEKSKNYTVGMTLSPAKDVSVTADLYKIAIDDRIVLSGRFDENNFPALGGILQSLGVGQAQFFVNSVDTETKGFDLTVSHKADFAGGKLSTFLALNLSKTTITQIRLPSSFTAGGPLSPLDRAVLTDTFIAERDRLFIEQGGPRNKATLNFNYVAGKLESDLKIIRFGAQTLGTFTGSYVYDFAKPNTITRLPSGTPNAYYAPKTSADLAFTWAFDKNTKLTVGGANIFNVKPSKQDPNETDNGFIYDSVQFGLNGASYFARFWKSFR